MGTIWKFFSYGRFFDDNGRQGWSRRKNGMKKIPKASALGTICITR